MKVAKALGVALLLIGAVLAIDMCQRRDQAIRDRRESRQYAKLYDDIFDVVLVALTDSTSGEVKARETDEEMFKRLEAPRSPADSARAEEATELILDRIRENPTGVKEWLKD